MEIVITASDIIEIFGIIASLITGIVAIVISVKTLRQNALMIEESTRPQIQIYPVYMNGFLYLVIKNFGTSEAYIDSIKCSHSFSPEEIPGQTMSGDIFSVLNGSILSSGYSIRCPLLGYKVPNEIFDFEVKYHSSSRKYESKFSFNPLKNAPYADLYPSSSAVDGHLSNIAKELRDIVKTNL